MDLLKTLRPKDYEILVWVLQDLKKCINGEIGIGGSLAQRMLSAEIAAQLKDKKLNDTDLLLFSHGTQPLSPSVKENFSVLELSEGYIGLEHKRTHKWVDVFIPEFSQEYVVQKINGDEYKIGTLESQVLYLARNILKRRQCRETIRQKWLDKLQVLYSLSDLNKVRVETLFEERKEYFYEVSDVTPIGSSAYIELALRQKATPKIVDLFAWLYWRVFVAPKAGQILNN